RFSPPEVDEYVGQAFLLGRVLLNLTTNGLKFTNEGYVHVSAQPAGHGRLQSSVRDTGRGIDAKTADSLFEPFKKASSGSLFFSGSGLGLAIARRMLRSMDAELHYESRPGWGTMFFFELHMPHLKGL